MDLITIVIILLIAGVLIYTYKLPIMCYGCESPSGISAHIFRCIIDTTENSPLCNISKGITELSSGLENGQNIISRAVFSEFTKGIPETIQKALENIMIKIEELMASIIQVLTDLPAKLAEYLKTGFEQIKNTVIKSATVLYNLLIQPIVDYIVNYIITPVSGLIKTLLDFKKLITDAINKSVQDVSGVFLDLQNNVINAITEIPQAIQELVNCVVDSLNVALNTVGDGFNTVLQPFGQLKNTIDPIINTINPIVTTVLPMIDKISTTIDTVTESTDKVLSTVTGTIKNVSGSVESVTSSLRTILLDLKKTLVPVTGALTEITNTTNNAIGTLNSSMNTVKKPLIQLIDGVKPIGGAVKDITRSANSIIGNLNTGMNNIKDPLKKVIGAIQPISEGIGSVTGLVNKGVDGINKISGPLQTVAGAMKPISDIANKAAALGDFNLPAINIDVPLIGNVKLTDGIKIFTSPFTNMGVNIGNVTFDGINGLTSMQLPNIPNLSGLLTSSLDAVGNTDIRLPDIPDLSGLVTTGLDSIGNATNVSFPAIPDIGASIDVISDMVLGGYSVQKNRDYPGNDIGNTCKTNFTLEQCKDACNGDSSCLGFNHNNPTQTGHCCLKNKLVGPTNPNEWTFYTKNSGLIGELPGLATSLANITTAGLNLQKLGLTTMANTAQGLLTLGSSSLLSFDKDGKLVFSLIGGGTPFDGTKDRCGISKGGPISQVDFKAISTDANNIFSGITKGAGDAMGVVTNKLGEPFKIAASQISDAYNALMAPINNAIVLLTSFAATIVESIKMLFTKYFNMDYLNALIAKIQEFGQVTVQIVLDILYNEIIVPIFGIVTLIKDKIQDGINFVISALVNTFKLILSQIKSIFNVIADSLYNAGKFIINNAGYMAFYYISESIDKLIPLPIQKTGKLTIVYYGLMSLVIVFLYMYIAQIELVLMIAAGIAAVTGVLYFTLPPP